MNYLHVKRTKKNKFFYIFVLILLFLFLFYFRSPIWRGFSFLSHGLFRPVLLAGNGISARFSGLRSFFVSKNNLYLDNQDLKNKLQVRDSRTANYDYILAENKSL